MITAFLFPSTARDVHANSIKMISPIDSTRSYNANNALPTPPNTAQCLHPPLRHPLSPLSMIPKTLLLIKQIGPRAPQIDNLGTPIAVLLKARALEAVEGVADALAAADYAFVLVVPEAALVADAHERGGPHVAVADGAFAVALVAQAPDGDAGLFAAHDEVAGRRAC